jgi:Tfp pilus assembly protein PilF
LSRGTPCVGLRGRIKIEAESLGSLLQNSRFAPLAAVLLLLAPGARAANKASREQVQFGIRVARDGLWAEARFRFERAVALDPKNAAALNDLAVACEQAGDFAKARETYEAALKLKPKDSRIQQNYDLFREADDKRNRRTKKRDGEKSAP